MALTDLASVKEYAKLDSNEYNGLLQALIGQVSDRIERITGRTFSASDYVEWKRIHNFRLMPDNWPVIRLKRIGWGFEPSLEIQYDGSGISAQVSVSRDDLRLFAVASDGTESDNMFAWSDYPSTSQLETQIDGLSDWSATVLENRPSRWLRPISGVELDPGETITLDAASDTLWATWDDKAGVIKTPVGDSQWPVLLQYRGGYESIPRDVKLVANQMVSDAFNEAGQNMTMQSESLGDYSYSLASNQRMTRRQLTLLAPYMVSR